MDPVRKRRVIILGCTGSIGSTALASLKAYRESFEIVGVSAHVDYQKLFKIAQEWNVRNVCLSSSQFDKDATHLNTSKHRFFLGSQGLFDMIDATEADIVLNGIAGAPGLPATFHALESGKDVALANKESIVMAG
ncbi:MAG: 1-deoxy-D-xylulose-5-phosphate reductoisomerase, partial [Spirochaetae bacterium HGW-Spirochaetae-8]